MKTSLQNMEQMHTISVGKTESGLLVVFQEKTENSIEKGLDVKNEILDPQSLIGKSEHEVLASIKDRCVFRIAERDGKGYELTASHLPFHWNLYINDDVVTNIKMF